MNITRLRFQNLNSLSGTWCIDFTHPDYTQQGIFAITGPTGAGKSTILDAICLALFGQTPRLGGISKSDNEIMSRHSGQCFAEVEFQIDGTLYRSTWSQSRAHGKATGRLQEAKHELANASTGVILEEKKSRTLPAIEALTHLNFERFTRSVLLAQGSFAAFLQAEVKDRADMLQQITGTEIYADISIAVHQRKKQAEDTLAVLQAALSGMVLLPPEHVAQLQQEQHDCHHANLQATEQQRALLQIQEHLKRQISLQQEHNRQQHDWQLLQTEQAQFAPQNQRLKLALKAANLLADFRSLSHARQQHTQFEQQQRQLQDALPTLLAAEQHAKDSAKQQQSEQLQFQDAYHVRQKLWQHVSAIDQQLQQTQQRVTELTSQWQQEQQRGQEWEREQQTLQQELAQKEQAWQDLNEHLAQQHALSRAVPQWEAWQQQHNRWHTQQLLAEQHHQQQHDAEQAKQLQANLQRQHDDKITALTTKQAQLQQAHTQAQAQLTQLLAGQPISAYEIERDLLYTQRRLLTTIESLEQERAHLLAGAPCPLCGALEHPYAHANAQLPQVSDTDERLQQLKTLLQQHQHMQQHLHELGISSEHTQMALDEANLAAQAHAQELARLQDAYQIARDKWQHSRTLAHDSQLALHQAWQACGFEAVETLDFERLQHDIKQHIQQQQQAQTDVHLLQNLRSRLLSTQQQHAQWRTQEQSLSQQLQQWQQQHAEQQRERESRFGAHSIASDEATWQQRQREQEQRLQDACSAHNQATAQYQHTQNQWEQGKVPLHECAQLVTQLSAAWQAALQAHGFADEAQWQQQQLPAAECAALQQQQQALQHRAIALQQALTQTEQELSALQTVLPESPPSLPDLQQQITRLQDAMAQHSQRMGAIEQQLAQQRATETKMAEQGRLIAAQQETCSRWRNLHALIGSADGSKYRLFAQSLTFNHLLQAANLQLQRMSDRYTLKQSDSQLLHLDVVDAYQAGTVRSAKNLSGGESFIVSLALALGLSRLSSQKTRIDSLFLDEGFGTLDEDALDTALNALASLQQEGKLIGIISHVTALKERIATQIKVTPKQGGKSVLHGSGVTRTD